MTIIFAVLAILGWTFGIWCWWHLRRWSIQLTNARVAVAYKRKVKLDQPLIEWLLWANRLRKDKETNAHTIYIMGGTHIIIRKPVRARKRYRKQAPSSTPRVREGTWSAKDETVKV